MPYFLSISHNENSGFTLTHARTANPLALEQRALAAGDVPLACRARVDVDVARLLLDELGAPLELVLYAFERQLRSPLGTLSN